MPHSASRRHPQRSDLPSDSETETASDYASSVEEMKSSTSRRKSSKHRSAGGSSKHRSKTSKSRKSGRTRSRSRSRSSSRSAGSASENRRHRKSRRVDRTVIISDSSDVEEIPVENAPGNAVSSSVSDIPMPPPLTAPVALAPLPKVDVSPAVVAALASLPPPPPPPMTSTPAPPVSATPQAKPLDLSAVAAAGPSAAPEAHIQAFGVNAGAVQPSAAASSNPGGEEIPGYQGSGINLDIEAIKDLSNSGAAERLRRVHLFQMGGGYFFRVGPTPFHAQGGTYDSVAFGRVTDGKNPGDKPKTSVVHIPIRATPQLVEGLTKLRERFDDRKPVTLSEIALMADSSAGDIDLSSRIEFTAPKEGYKIDAGHIIAGETVAINKSSSFEAITICRLPKLCGYNGKPTQKYSLHIPLRFLPTMQTLATFAMQTWSGEAVPDQHQ